MLDFLAFIIGFFLICLIGLIIWIGVKFLYNLATVGKSNNSYSKETDRQVTEDSIEDSHGDGLFIADNDSEDLFPEEFNTDDEY